MQVISANEVDRRLDFAGLVETLRRAFQRGAVQPVRHHHSIERDGGTASTLLLMPAWSDFSKGAEADGYIGVKIVTVSPDNNAIGKPAVMGQYLLLEGRTGEPLALIDGQRLTQWRTACASALASSYLSREESSRLLVVGAGALSTFLARPTPPFGRYAASASGTGPRGVPKRQRLNCRRLALRQSSWMTSIAPWEMRISSPLRPSPRSR